MKKYIICFILLLITFFGITVNKVDARILKEYHYAKDYVTYDQDVICVNSSITSDFDYLDITMTDNTETHIVTFVSGYGTKDNKKDNVNFVYFYYPSSLLYSNQSVVLHGYYYDDLDTNNYSYDKSVEITASIISCENNIYKAIINHDKLSSIFNEKRIHFDNMRIYYPLELSIKNEGIAFDVYDNEYNYTDIAISQDILFREKYDESTNKRIYSCVNYDYIGVIVEGQLGYYRFAATTESAPWNYLSFWSKDIVNTYNYYDLWFFYFNVNENGKVWDDDRTIYQIDYTVYETNIDTVKTYRYAYLPEGSIEYAANPQWVYEKTQDRVVYETNSYEMSITNDSISFLYPVDVSKENFLTWATNDFEVYNKVTFPGIWNVNNLSLKDELSKSENYDPKKFSGYNFACVVGNTGGYAVKHSESEKYSSFFETIKVVNFDTLLSGKTDILYPYVERYDKTTNFTKLDVEFAKIYYVKDGVKHWVEVDETIVDYIGEIGGVNEFESNVPGQVVEGVGNGGINWLLVISIILIVLLVILIMIIVAKISKYFRELRDYKNINKVANFLDNKSETSDEKNK